MTPSEKIGWALRQLGHSGVRVTPVREKVLTFLATQDVPVTLHEISQSGDLGASFDGATVYRTLVLMVELEVVRQFQFRNRAISFLLNVPGECIGFLICRSCGTIRPVPHGADLLSLEERAAAMHGYTAVTHELQLYGLCRNCGHNDNPGVAAVKPSKLLAGMRLRRGSEPCLI